MAKKKAEPKKADASGYDWKAAETKLREAVKRKEKDGHFYNTVVAPLLESFEAGGRNEQLYIAMMQL